VIAAEEQQSGAGATDADGPGVRLGSVREQQGLSIESVAHELHLEVDVVRAIEAENFSALGAPVFVKGYLRGYARLLDLPEQQLVDAWQPEEHDADAFRTLSMQKEMKPGASLPIFVLWVALSVLVIVGLIYLLFGGEEQPEPEPAFVEQVSATPVVVVPPREQDFVVVEEAAVEESPLAPKPVKQEPVKQESVKQEPVQPDTVELSLTFSEECWVEVSDASRRLLYGLEKAGSVRSFVAQPPLRFFVGNVTAVDIQFSGQQYNIPAGSRTGRNTARFVVSADDLKEL